MMRSADARHTASIETLATVPGRVAAGTGVGTLKLTASAIAVTTPLQTTAALAPPSWWERIAHG